MNTLLGEDAAPKENAQPAQTAQAVSIATITEELVACVEDKL